MDGIVDCTLCERLDDLENYTTDWGRYLASHNICLECGERLSFLDLPPVLGETPQQTEGTFE